jgi:hypothetical protein
VSKKLGFGFPAATCFSRGSSTWRRWQYADTSALLADRKTLPVLPLPWSGCFQWTTRPFGRSSNPKLGGWPYLNWTGKPSIKGAPTVHESERLDRVPACDFGESLEFGVLDFGPCVGFRRTARCAIRIAPGGWVWLPALAVSVVDIFDPCDLSGRATARYEMQDQRNDRYNQKQVDEAARYVESCPSH